MPGFSQQSLNYNARSANTVIMMIGTQPILFAQTVTHSFELGTEGFYGIGSAKPQEIQQLKAAPTITLDNFQLTAAGQLASQGNNAYLSSLIANNEFNISIVDGATGVAIYTYVGCVASNFSESIPTNQPISDTVTFLALDVLDTSGQSILNGPSALPTAL